MLNLEWRSREGEIRLSSDDSSVGTVFPFRWEIFLPALGNIFDPQLGILLTPIGEYFHPIGVYFYSIGVYFYPIGEQFYLLGDWGIFLPPIEEYFCPQWGMVETSVCQPISNIPGDTILQGESIMKLLRNYGLLFVLSQMRKGSHLKISPMKKNLLQKFWWEILLSSLLNQWSVESIHQCN